MAAAKMPCVGRNSGEGSVGRGSVGCGVVDEGKGWSRCRCRARQGRIVVRRIGWGVISSGSVSSGSVSWRDCDQGDGEVDDKEAIDLVNAEGAGLIG